MAFKLFPIVAALLIASFGCGSAAHADVGWIDIGGDVHLMSENPTVSMRSEVVEIVVSKETVQVDSRYVFVNNGPACKVRMGFPDEASEIDVENPTEKPFGTFLSYEAYADELRLPVESVEEKRPPDLSRVWHACDVDFAEKQTQLIRSLYTTCPNVTGDEDGIMFAIGYVLGTAASWHGPLESADVNIRFEADALPGLLTLVVPEQRKFATWKDAPRGAIYCEAPVVPTLNDRTLMLRMKDKKFGKDDGILVMYGHLSEKQADEFLENVKKKRLTEAIARQKNH